MNTKLIKIFFFATVVIQLSSCARSPKTSDIAPSPLPQSWLNQSETQTEASTVDTFEKPSEAAAQNLDAIFKAQGTAIDLANVESFKTNLPPSEISKHPADWTPWHLEYLMTDLSVSVSGWLGSLIKKGTPSVTVMWRKQNIPVNPQTPQNSANDNVPSVALSEGLNQSDLKKEIEPIIQGSLASGKIDDETAFRQNMLSTATDFVQLATYLNSAGNTTWWVSRFRLDLTVDASGNVTPAVAVGGDLRVRLEWHRIMKKQPALAAQRISNHAAYFGIDDFETKLIDFSNSVSDDLQMLTADDESSLASGFQAYGYRIGLGISDSGKIGIAKWSGTMTGQIYFARDVKKPSVKPAVTADAKPFNLIAGGQNVVEIKRNQFRNGLNRALNIGRFFANRAANVSTKSRWKIYEIRAGFDLNFGGRSGLAKVNGFGSSEISFYNENF